MAITELKKIAKKEILARSKLLKPLELLGLALDLLGYLLAIALMKFETLSANLTDRTR